MTLTKADAFYLVSKWHREQGDLYTTISKDEPRVSKELREQAAIAAKHHYGSSAALSLKAHSLMKEII